MVRRRILDEKGLRVWTPAFRMSRDDILALQHGARKFKDGVRNFGGFA
jgi:hypothetical protein